MGNIAAIRSAVQPRFLVAYLLCLSLIVAALFAISSQRALSPDSQQVSQASPTPYLGLTYVQLSHDLASRYSLQADMGLLVTEVSQGSPAALAGFRTGDILLSADSAPLTQAISLLARLVDRQPGDTVDIELLRDGEVITLKLVAGTRR